MIPELPAELGRFDSIVEAHKAGDMQALKHAVRQNRQTIEAIVQESLETIGRYSSVLQVLRDYDCEVMLEVIQTW